MSGELLVTLGSGSQIMTSPQMSTHPFFHVHLHPGHAHGAVAVMKVVGPAPQGPIEFADDAGHGHRRAVPAGQFLGAGHDRGVRPTLLTI